MELTDLESQFTQNLNEEKSTVEYLPEELLGLPQDFLARLKKSKDGKHLAVTTKSTDYMQVMDNATSPESRRKMLTAYENRAQGKNTEILEKAIILREQIANLVGFKNWANYRIQGRMAKNGTDVERFLAEVRAKIKLRLKSDLKTLLSGKRELAEPKAKNLESWDIRYLETQIKKRDYEVDDEVIREYFPRDVVMSGLFNVYSTLLGVSFEEIKNAAVWSPEVKLYAIHEKGDNRLIGYFFTDFVPREGKYGHAAAFPLIAGRRLEDGSYSIPVAAIVANFTPPANGKPSLLGHKEVETIFHEFGHIMHQTLTRAPYAFLSGANVAQDFVEAPSQMLENWVWDEEVLNLISGHYKDPSKKLPKALMRKMLASRDFNRGYFYSRQLVLALEDMAMHTAKGRVDVTALFKTTYKDVVTIPALAETHFNASFGHLMGGYDAGYYGYLWSEVLARDMFTQFSKKGLLNPEVGMSYRKNILEKGNMVDANILLKDFLGREANNKAFTKNLLKFY